MSDSTSADGLSSSYESKDYTKSSSGRYGTYNSKRTHSPSLAYDGDCRDKDYERTRDRGSDRYRDQDMRSRLSPG